MLSESAAAETAVTIFRIWSLSFFVVSPVFVWIARLWVAGSQ